MDPQQEDDWGREVLPLPHGSTRSSPLPPKPLLVPSGQATLLSKMFKIKNPNLAPTNLLSDISPIPTSPQHSPDFSLHEPHILRKQSALSAFPPVNMLPLWLEHPVSSHLSGETLLILQVIIQVSPPGSLVPRPPEGVGHILP